jgi:hypothetical protein
VKKLLKLEFAYYAIDPDGPERHGNISVVNDGMAREQLV